MTWNDLLSTLKSNSSFLITSHVSLDGDCVGSQLALYWYLRSLGKRVTVYNVDPLPHKFRFLQNTDALTTTRPEGPFDVLIVLDCSNLSRLGWDGCASAAPRIVNIDHHSDNTLFGVVNHVRTSAATGEILFDFFDQCGIDYPGHVAEALYTAIMTDTGAFRFSNTTPRILRICGDLADKGASPAKIHEMVYESNTPAGMRLLSRVWGTLQFHRDGTICAMDLPLGLIDQLGATYSDSEGMADLTITVTGVEVGLFMKHTPKQTHFSLRSKDRVDVGKIARMVTGGGGHHSAAGCTLDGPMAETLPRMLELIGGAMDAAIVRQAPASHAAS